MNQSILIVCESMYHGNTKKLADGMSKELKCRVVTCDEAEKLDLSSYSIIGLGSGIYFTSHHPKLVALAGKLSKNQKAFIFSTRGAPFLGKYHDTIKRVLKTQNVQVVGEFSCKGYDCTGPFNLVHGGNKGKPNESDVRKARKFVRRIAEEYLPNQYDKSKMQQQLKETGKHVGIEEKLCIGCGMCQKTCPMHVFEVVDGKSVVMREEDCTHCSMCTDLCPQDCITIQHTRKELIGIAKRHASRTSL